LASFIILLFIFSVVFYNYKYLLRFYKRRLYRIIVCNRIRNILERAILVKDYIIKYFRLFLLKKEGKGSKKIYKYSNDVFKTLNRNSLLLFITSFLLLRK
jgi:hypothetical protein